MNSNVIDLFRTRSAAEVGPTDPPAGQPGACPDWCTNDDAGHEFHRGAFRAHFEHDENNEVVMALGGRVEAMFPSAPPMVSVLLWEAEEGVVVAEGRGLLSPAEAREVAGHLLRLADEAEGVR